MPMARRRSERQAPAKNGAAAKHSTGSIRNQLPQSSSFLYSAPSSPGALKYAGAASIMICIAQKLATNSRQIAWRDSRWRALRAAKAVSGAAS